MSTSGIIGAEIDKQAALASAAIESISGVGAGTAARQLLPGAVLDMLGHLRLRFTSRNALCSPPRLTNLWRR